MLAWGEAAGERRAALSDSTAAGLLAAAERKPVPKGAILFRQGKRHQFSYFILDGLIKTFYLSPLGKTMTLGHWSAGEMVGGPDFFADAVHVWSASAITNSVVLAIEGAALERLTKRHPDLAQYVIRSLTFKMHWLSVLLQTVCTESVTDRLAHLLVQLAETYGTPCEQGIAIPQSFNQEELANMVGASRQWVNLTLGRLHRARLIENANRKIVVLDVPGLKRTGVIALTAGTGP